MGKPRRTTAQPKATSEDELRAFSAECRAGRAPRTIVVTGDDSYRCTEVVRRLPQLIVGAGHEQCSVVHLEGRDVSPEQILAEIESSPLPFFDSACRVVVVRDCPLFDPKLAERVDLLTKRIEAGLPGDVTLILEAPEATAASPLYKACATAGRVLHFPKVSSTDEARSFVLERFRHTGARIDGEALDLLLALAPSETGLLAAEVRKLALYAGARKSVTVDDVRALVTRTRETVIFEVTDAIGERNLERALVAVRALLHQGQSALGVVMLLAGRLRLLLVTRALLDRGAIPASVARASRYGDDFRRHWRQVAAELRPLMPEERGANLAMQHDYVVFKTIQEAKRYTAEELRTAMGLASKADVALKTNTGFSDTDVVENLVVGLCAKQVTLPVA